MLKKIFIINKQPFLYPCFVAKKQPKSSLLQNTPTCSLQGMSLIEVTVVLFIVALIFSVSLPMFRVTKKTPLETAALDMQLNIQAARDDALITGKTVFFRIFMESRKMNLYEGSPKQVFKDTDSVDSVKPTKSYPLPKGVKFLSVKNKSNISVTSKKSLFSATPLDEEVHDIQIDGLGIIDIFNLNLSDGKHKVTISAKDWLGHILMSKPKTI